MKYREHLSPISNSIHQNIQHTHMNVEKKTKRSFQQPIPTIQLSFFQLGQGEREKGGVVNVFCGGSTPNAASDWVGSVQINQNSYGGFQKDLQRIILARVTKVWGEDGKVRGSDPCKEKKNTTKKTCRISCIH